MKHTFSANVWLYPGESAAWHFITVPKVLSAKLKKMHGANARGWGSLPVTVKVGKTTWSTSIFPDSKSGTYLLPLKAAVRKVERLEVGETARVSLTLR